MLILLKEVIVSDLILIKKKKIHKMGVEILKFKDSLNQSDILENINNLISQMRKALIL